MASYRGNLMIQLSLKQGTRRITTDNDEAKQREDSAPINMQTSARRSLLNKFHSVATKMDGTEAPCTSTTTKDTQMAPLVQIEGFDADVEHDKEGVSGDSTQHKQIISLDHTYSSPMKRVLPLSDENEVAPLVQIEGFDADVEHDKEGVSGDSTQHKQIISLDHTYSSPMKCVLPLSDEDEEILSGSDTDYVPNSSDDSESSSNSAEVADKNSWIYDRDNETLNVEMEDNDQHIDGTDQHVDDTDQHVDGTDQQPPVTSEKKLVRKNIANPDSWKKNKRKKIKDFGEEYITVRGKVREKRRPKDVNCKNSRFKCSEVVSEENRSTLCKEFWDLGDYNRQKDYILRCTEQTKIMRERPRKDRNRLLRSVARFYSFQVNDNPLRVCKKFFRGTLSISNSTINSAISGRSPSGSSFVGNDRRGKHTPSNKTTSEDLNYIKEHIESFPVMESHYVRKTIKKHYLDPKLSIRKMYLLYKKNCQSEKPPRKPVSASMYRKVFCTNFNLSFFRPRKDLCQLCDRYKRSSESDKEKLKEQYELHLKRKKDAQDEKMRDKERAAEDKTFVSVTVDLQSVLQIPSSEVSQLYYSRKLNLYNFTVYESAFPNNAFCYFWSEINGKRGSSEIGTCVYLYLKQLTGVSDVTIFSDTCAGQNRNQHLASILLYATETLQLNSVTQKFLESGHSQMECDAMHSSIETEKKYVDVYSIIEWKNIFRRARRRNPYNVTTMMFSDFMNLSELSKTVMRNRNKDINGDTVRWLDIKQLKFEKSKPGVMSYSYNYSDEMREVFVYGKGRPPKMPNKIPTLYKAPIPISKQKKDDLIKLCKSSIISAELHGWYQSLSVSNKPVTVPEPGYLDSGDESDSM